MKILTEPHVYAKRLVDLTSGDRSEAEALFQRALVSDPRFTLMPATWSEAVRSAIRDVRVVRPTIN